MRLVCPFFLSIDVVQFHEEPGSITMACCLNAVVLLGMPGIWELLILFIVAAVIIVPIVVVVRVMKSRTRRRQQQSSAEPHAISGKEPGSSASGLSPCVACGKEISNRAASCPKCGAPNPLC